MANPNAKPLYTKVCNEMLNFDFIVHNLGYMCTICLVAGEPLIPFFCSLI